MRAVWFADTEVFKHDNLWVFKNKDTGETVYFWNDNEGVVSFIEENDPILCGYNFRDYDSQILKGNMLGFTPEMLHEVSMTIVTNPDRTAVWRLFDGYGWVTLPPVIDLFHDIVPRRGLKELEAHMGMAIEESSVPFTIDRPLTDEERDEVLHYCVHDVNATERLYNERQTYITSKVALCELFGVDPLDMLKHTNARIVTDLMKARKREYPNEQYIIPDNLNTVGIPTEVLDYVNELTTERVERKGGVGVVGFMFHDTAAIMGVGGIHTAPGKLVQRAGQVTTRPTPVVRRSDEDRVLLLQDITSYYPSLIIENDYMTRAVSQDMVAVYEDLYNRRVKGKGTDDKETSNALKLVLNSTYGVMRMPMSKMYDPMRGLSICMSGQLYILDVINRIFERCPSAELIQANTDGWLIGVDRSEVSQLNEAVEEWETRTKFNVETVEVQTVIQSNVNNYILELADGSVKTKGGVVGKYNGTTFSSASAPIIDKAVVDYLLYGTPVEDTINSCNDPKMFQIVARAGRAYGDVVYGAERMSGDDEVTYRHKYFSPEKNKEVSEVMYRCTLGESLNRVNRVFATTDPDAQTLFKVKYPSEQMIQFIESEGGTLDGICKIERIADTPDKALVFNESIEDLSEESLENLLTTLDRSWYNIVAQNKARDFVGSDYVEEELSMSNDVVVEPGIDVEDTTPKRTVKRRATNDEQTAEKPKTKAKSKAKPKPQEEAPEVPIVDVADIPDVVDTQPAGVGLAYKLLQLQKVMSSESTKVEFDKVVTMGKGGFDYADTQQYKQLLVKKLNEVGLVFSVNFPTVNWLGAVTTSHTGTSTFGAIVEGTITIADPEGGECAMYGITGMGTNTNPGYTIGTAQTNALRNFILNNYLLDNTGRDGDDQATMAQSMTGEMKINSKSGFVPDGQKKKIVENLTTESKQEKLATKAYMAALYDIVEQACAMDESFSEKVEQFLSDAYDITLGEPKLNDDGKSVIPMTRATKVYSAAEQIVNG